MNINDFLAKYRKPVFAIEGEGAPAAAPAGEPAAAPAGDGAGETALGGDAAPAGQPDGAAPEGDATAPAGEGEQNDPASGEEPDPAEFKVSAPEGLENYQGEFESYSSEASTWMQENPNATPADALKWAAERQAAAVSKQTQDISQAFTKQIETWEGEAKADKEIGGDNFGANLAVAKQAIDTFGSDELKSILNESGLGSHPSMIKFAVKAGKSISDASVIKPNVSMSEGSALQSRYNKS